MDGSLGGHDGLYDRGPPPPLPARLAEAGPAPVDVRSARPTRDARPTTRTAATGDVPVRVWGPERTTAAGEYAADAPCPSGPGMSVPPAKRPAGSAKLGTVVVDREAGRLTVPGRICLQRGILEYAAVGPSGKAYESGVVLNTRGLHLQLGLTLLGLTPYPWAELERTLKGEGAAWFDSLGAQGARPAAAQAPASSRLTIEVEILDGPKPRRMPLHELFMDRQQARAPLPGEVGWVFTGAPTREGRFIGDHYEQYVALWPEEAAIVNPLRPASNPYRSAGGYELHPTNVPPPGTPIRVHFRPVSRAAPEQAGEGLRLREAAAAAGLDFVHDSGARGERRLPETNSGGGGFWDPDGDGDPDVLLLSGAPVGPGGRPASTVRHYENDGRGRFVDRTAQAGLVAAQDAQTYATADVDGDGDLDLAVAGYEHLRLFLQEPGGRFRDVSQAWGLGGFSGFANALAWGDLDGDRLPELIVGRYAVWDPELGRRLDCRREDGRPTYCGPDQLGSTRLIVYRNAGGKLVDDTARSGAGRRPVKALGIVVLDEDSDGDLDLLVASDREPNLLLRNRGGGTFDDEGLLRGIVALDGMKAPAGMGVAVGDPLGDGRTCLAVGNFTGEPVTLHCRPSATPGAPGADYYAELTHRGELARATMPWVTFGLAFADLDLDGRSELLVANGHVQDVRELVGTPREQPLQVLTFEDDGGRPAARDRTPDGGVAGVTAVGRALAVADVDSDGDLDALLVANGGPVRLIVNDTPPRGRSLRVRAVDERGRVDVVGARVSLAVAGRTLAAQVVGGGSYAGESERTLTFALPADARPETVEVAWPGGPVRRYALPAGAPSLLVRRPADRGRPTAARASGQGDRAERLRRAMAGPPADPADAEQRRKLLAEALARAPGDGVVRRALARLSPVARAVALLAEGAEDPLTRRDLALARLASGDRAGAAREIEALVEAAPDGDFLILQLLTRLLERKAADLARPVLDRLIAEAPRRLDLRALNAAGFLLEGRPARARAEADAIVRRAPSYAGGHIVLGYVELQQRRPAEAARAFEAALAIGIDGRRKADAEAGLAAARAQLDQR